MFAVASKLAIGAEPGPSATAASEGANVRLCIDPDWAPYEWLDEQGRHRGIAADLTRLIAARAGLRLSIVQSTSWDESLSLARTGKCDALSFLNETPERAGWLSFTRPYFFDRNVIITRAEHPDIASLADLPAGTMIALPTATSIIEQVGRDFPGLRILPVASEAEALGMVEQREAELTLRALTIVAHTIKTEGWFNLKIAGEVPAYGNRMRIGIVGKRPELLAALDTAIASLTPEEVDEIVNRHVAIDVASGVDRILLLRISAGFFLLLLLAYLWIRHLRGVNQRLAALGRQLGEDIAARQRVEQALKESEERYRSLVEMAHESIIVVQDANRALLFERLERALAAAQRNHHLLAVLFIDLDGFKPVNDRYGHDIGDALLQAVAQRLQGLVRESDTAARIGGDEFVVLLPMIAADEDADNVAGKLHTALASPFDIHGQRIIISGSIGVALYPRDGDSAPALMQRADGAMYREKQIAHAR